MKRPKKLNRREAERWNPSLRGASGSVSAEFAAAVCLFTPVTILVIFACFEIMTAFLIQNALVHSAHVAAMALSKAYGGDASYATSLDKQREVFQGIKFSNIVISPDQFSATFPPIPSTADWTTPGNMPAVTVTCSYKGGQYGLPPFPSPDPLNLGSNFTLKAQATAYLE